MSVPIGQPLKIAQARLAMRTKLPGDEACLDLPHIMLLEEVGQIEVCKKNTLHINKSDASNSF